MNVENLKNIFYLELCLLGHKNVGVGVALSRFNDSEGSGVSAMFTFSPYTYLRNVTANFSLFSFFLWHVITFTLPL